MIASTARVLAVIHFAPTYDSQVTGVILGTTDPSRARRTAGVIAATVVLALVVTALLVLRAGGLHGTQRADRAEHASDSISRLGSTRWRMATFNVLGSGHTDGPGADTTGYPSAKVRMGNTVEILKREGLSIVGFQEMRLDQYDEFNDLTGTGWDVWPERPTNTTVFAQRHIANTLAWRTSTWKAVRQEYAQIRYINDESTVNYPVVWLKNRVTGQTVIAANFHNVSDKFTDEIAGGSVKRRAEEVGDEIALANRLRAENPDVPILFSGDFNERETFFCRIAAATALRAANGGWATSTGCQPPSAPLPVDWLLGTTPATFSGWTRLRDSLVKQTTDHPVVIAQVAVPPAVDVTAPVDHVVLVSLEGVRSKTIAALGASASGFNRLRKYGASTLNARTVERTTSLSNVTSMLTGRPVSTSIGGHGVVDGTSATTVHQTAGRYVASVMDLVHDRGLRTALFTNDPRAAILDRSWNAANGASDLNWTNNGRDKISTYGYYARPGGTAGALYRSLVGSSPAAFTYGQLSLADDVGHASGFSSDAYRSAVIQVSKQVNQIVDAIDANPVLAGHTLLIVAGEHGGSGTSHLSHDVLANVRVPLFVRGPGVPKGADLYAMNPNYVDPGSGIPGYHGGQPIRPAMIADLATAVLTLPAVPGSTMNTQQNFTVFGAP